MIEPDVLAASLRSQAIGYNPGMSDMPDVPPMPAAPRIVGGAKVFCFTPIDSRHRHTGNCRQIVAGVLQGPAAGIAICQYEGEDYFYLFGCDSSWNTVTDTWHQTLDEALAMAEFEYEGISKTWQTHDKA